MKKDSEGPVWDGPDYWKVELGPKGEIRVKPRNHSSLTVVIAASSAVWLSAGLFWLALSGFANYIDAIIVVGGTTALLAISGIFSHVNNYQLQRGPYLDFDGRCLRFRNGRRVELGEVESIFVKYNREPSNEFEVARLIVGCKSGEEVEILKSIYHGSIASLKNTIQAQLESAGRPGRM